MIRFLYVVLDLSHAVNEEDMRPSRLRSRSDVQVFSRILVKTRSVAGLVVTRNGMERLTELSGNPETHIAALKENLMPQVICRSKIARAGKHPLAQFHSTVLEKCSS